MQTVKWIAAVILLVLLNHGGYAQQLRLGNTSYGFEKSAVLELQSTNQGLLFPRIADTALINVLNPPDGMVIFFTPSKQLLLRSNGYWNAMTLAPSLAEYWSLNGNNTGAIKKIGSIDNYAVSLITNNSERIHISGDGNVGIGTSSFDGTNPEKLLVDAGVTSSFNVISGKGSINNYLQLNIQNRSNGNTASSDLVATADNGTESANFVDLGINSSAFSNAALPILNGANNAYLYSTGNDFIIGNGTAGKNLQFFTGGYATANERLRIDGNGRIGMGVTAPTAVLHLKAGTTAASTAPLKFTSGSLMTTAQVGAVEFLTDKFYGTITTGAARKEFTLNDAALTSGRVPVITTNGRLTSNANFVWNNTNSRLGIVQATPTAYLHLGAGTAAANTAPLKFTTGINLTTPEDGAVEFDGSHFYGTIGSTRYQLDQQAGTTYTGSNGITLTGNEFSNNLITGIAGGQTITGGTNAGNALTITSTGHATKGKLLFGTSAYDEANNRLGIGNNTPGEALDITGNLKFSGALMPGNNAGSSAQLLRSNGAGTAPSWTNISLTDLADISISSPASGQLLRYNGSSWVNYTPGYLSSVDTSNISNFYQKVRGLFSAAAPITFANGQIGITQAGTSSAGYLNSTDWNTFNNKLSSVDTSNISNFHLKVRSLFSAGSGITYNASTGAISSSQWSFTGNSGINPAIHFLGTTDDKQMILKSNNQSYLEFGRRQTLGLTQGYTDYDDNDEKLIHIRAAMQFEAPAASFYKPKMYTDTDGNFRVKGSSAGTDYFEFGSTGTSNNGGFEFIIGDDGDEPILFKSYHYINGMSEIMRLQSGRMAVGSNAFDATNPEKLLIDAGVTNSYNLMTGKGSIDNYLQINVQNRSTGGSASSDLVATSNNGSESANYIDMGINGGGYTNNSLPMLSGANTAYLYSTGNDFVLGNGTASKNMRFFTGGFATTNERMRIDGSGNVAIGATAFDGSNPEQLLVDAGSTSSFNVISGKGTINNYLQLNIQNRSTGNAASSDIVASADNGTESVNFVDLGINSSGYGNSGVLGGANNAYLYSTGNDFIIGNATAAKNLRFFAGGTATTNEYMRIDASGNVGIGTTSPSFPLSVEKSGGTVASFNRTSSDGAIISLRQAGTEEGTISVVGNFVSYNAFSGSHYGWTSQSLEKGMLVTLTGQNQYFHNNKNSEIIYGMEQTALPNDPKVMGAYLGLQESSKPFSTDNPHLIMAVGNGVMWVADKGENLSIGDYLVSSDIPGHAMKENGIYPTAFVIARVAEPVDWKNETAVINGVKHKMVSVLFESFVKNNAQKELENIKLELKALMERVKQLETKQ